MAACANHVLPIGARLLLCGRGRLPSYPDPSVWEKGLRDLPAMRKTADELILIDNTAMAAGTE